MDAENQILKSKLLQAESTSGKKDSSEHEPSSFIPKLQAPSSGSPKQESFPYHAENNFYSTGYDHSGTAQNGYNNEHNYNYDYGQGGSNSY